MAFTESLRNLIEQLHDSASVERVYGDPVSVDGRTVIPVASVRYGFGGGFGSNEGADEADGDEAGAEAMGTDEASSDETAPDETGGEGAAEGGGLGGGASASPVGVVEVTDAGTRVVRFSNRRRLLVALAAGFVLGLLLGRRSPGQE